jgi:signal peptidase I
MEKFLFKKLAFLPEEKRANAVLAIDLILNLIIIIILVQIIHGYIISPFQVFGSSMCNTLNFIDNECKNGYGEYIIVNKAIYQNFFGWQVGTPQRGDIIVFHPPQNPKEFYIKRVIGLPGETVKLKDGFVYIYNKEQPDGFKLDEPYLNETNQGNTFPSRMHANNDTFEVPEGQYFVLGDNRTGSTDSRMCFAERALSGECNAPGATPFLKPEIIQGKAWLVLWPLEKISVLESPKYQE